MKPSPGPDDRPALTSQADADAIAAKPSVDRAAVVTEWLARTPARLAVGRSGGSYRTGTHLGLKADHAAALDAVHAEFDLVRDLGEELVRRYELFEVQSQAASKSQYLVRPDLGRLLSAAGEQQLRRRCRPQAELQILIGDGLSTAAVAAQVPSLLPRLMDQAAAAGWQLGNPFAVRYCRVGMLNAVGRVLRPEVTILLIGERPGLATAESLSAYFAFRPAPGQTDADRNLISNIHAAGVPIADAVPRILALATQLKIQQRSGTQIKEQLAERSWLPSAVPTVTGSVREALPEPPASE